MGEIGPDSVLIENTPVVVVRKSTLGVEVGGQLVGAVVPLVLRVAFDPAELGLG